MFSGGGWEIAAHKLPDAVVGMVDLMQRLRVFYSRANADARLATASPTRMFWFAHHWPPMWVRLFPRPLAPPSSALRTRASHLFLFRAFSFFFSLAFSFSIFPCPSLPFRPRVCSFYSLLLQASRVRDVDVTLRRAAEAHNWHYFPRNVLMIQPPVVADSFFDSAHAHGRFGDAGVQIVLSTLCGDDGGADDDNEGRGGSGGSGGESAVPDCAM
jgi:hypothetical protein